MGGYNLADTIPADQTDPEKMDDAAERLRAALDMGDL